MGDLREQRKIVERIAIEPAFAEIGDPFAPAGKPCNQAFVLAFANIRHASHPTCKSTVDLLAFRRNHIVDAEFSGNRVREEAQHGCRHQQSVARGTMPFDQSPRRLPDARANLARQIFFAPTQQFALVERRQGR